MIAVGVLWDLLLEREEKLLVIVRNGEDELRVNEPACLFFCASFLVVPILSFSLLPRSELALGVVVETENRRRAPDTWLGCEGARLEDFDVRTESVTGRGSRGRCSIPVSDLRILDCRAEVATRPSQASVVSSETRYSVLALGIFAETPDDASSCT